MKYISFHIIEALSTGEKLTVAEIREKISRTGRGVSIATVQGTIGPLTVPGKRNISYFIRKERIDGRYHYSFVEPALRLSQSQLCGLTRKIGKDVFSLEEAVKEVPDLKKYIIKPARKPEKKKTQENQCDLEWIFISLLQEYALRGSVTLSFEVNIDAAFL